MQRQGPAHCIEGLEALTALKVTLKVTSGAHLGNSLAGARHRSGCVQAHNYGAQLRCRAVLQAPCWLAGLIFQPSSPAEPGHVYNYSALPLGKLSLHTRLAVGKDLARGVGIYLS
jgi:hypothetical protein